jgi:hypothetical protein
MEEEKMKEGREERKEVWKKERRQLANSETSCSWLMCLFHFLLFLAVLGF